MYNKNKIQAEIKNQILKKYQIDLKFNEKIRYALLPRPHFTTKNLSIIREKNEIGKAQNFKIFIGIKNFLRFDQTIIEDLVFVKTDFNFNKEDLFFFEDLLKTEPNENKIIFKKSNLFFNTEDDQLLFLNKINNSEFFYDQFNLENVLISKMKFLMFLINLLLKMTNLIKNYLLDLIQKIRLNIENNTSYEDDVKKGILKLLFINKDISLDYRIKKFNDLFH